MYVEISFEVTITNLSKFNRWIKFVETSKTFEVTQYGAELLGLSLDKSKSKPEHHDSVMSDVGAVEHSSDDETTSSIATPESPSTFKSPNSSPIKQHFKTETPQDSRADVMMVDAEPAKVQQNSPNLKPKDPAQETATESWLNSGFGQTTSPQKSPQSYYPSDAHKLETIYIYDNANGKEFSKV